MAVWNLSLQTFGHNITNAAVCLSVLVRESARRAVPFKKCFVRTHQIFI